MVGGIGGICYWGIVNWRCTGVAIVGTVVCTLRVGKEVTPWLPEG